MFDPNQIVGSGELTYQQVCIRDASTYRSFCLGLPALLIPMTDDR